MPLTDYTFRLGDSGIVLNDDSLSLPFVDVEEVAGLDSAPYRETTRDHEGVDGGFMDAEFEKARPITIDGTVYADPSTMENYLDDLKENYAPSRVLVPFYLKAPGSTEKVLFVKPQGARYDWDTNRRLGTARIQFNLYAEDPRIYDNSLQSIDVPFGGTALDGFGFPLGFPFGFGTTEIGNAATVTNTGNRPTPIEFTIYGPVTDPKIVNESASKTLEFNINLNTSDTLMVNTYYRTVRLNGSVNRRSIMLEPDWFDLAPGNNTIRFLSGSVTTTFLDTPLNANPYFETDATNWTVTGGTFVRSTAQFHEGTASGLLTPDGVTATVIVRSELVVTTVGLTYLASMWVRCASTRDVVIGIDWHDSADVFLSSSTRIIPVVANTWKLLQMTGVAPASGVKAKLTVAQTGTPPGSDLLYIDEAKIQAPTPSRLNVKFRSAWR